MQLQPKLLVKDLYLIVVRFLFSERLRRLS